MSVKNFTEYNLPQEAYATFDATTLKTLIINRLNESEIFRDQNFEGSNINSFIDIVAYMYHVLLFYLNTTASESTFTTAELYENINKLVSNIGYKPTGKQTSLVNIDLTGTSTLGAGQYSIKRFSYLSKDGVSYTTLKDISFEKTTASNEELSISNSMLHQGSIIEHPVYTAIGEAFEVIKIINTNTDLRTNSVNKFIADNTFTIFVKSRNTETWQEWTETSSLFLESAGSLKFEKRYNENGNYEFKFGNGLNGKQLQADDIVQIFYIKSDDTSGYVSANGLNGSSFIIYNTPTFNEISSDIYSEDNNFISSLNTAYITANNLNESIAVSSAETAAEIKNNAPKLFALQNRLVTGTDYESFITKNFNGFIQSVKAISNDTYTNKVLKYYYDIGLNRPNEDSRVLFNQVRYANSTSFNNVNLFTVPKNSIINEQIPNYTNPTQKQLILSECNNIKDITHNVVFADPVFKAFALGVASNTETILTEVLAETKLVIYKDRNNIVNVSNLKASIQNIFKTTFSKVLLGSTVSISEIQNSILNIYGVERIGTRRVVDGITYETPLISFIVWNPLYQYNDIIITSKDYKLEDFQYAYFYKASDIVNNIIIENS
jgi:hypothetical protein